MMMKGSALCFLVPMMAWGESAGAKPWLVVRNHPAPEHHQHLASDSFFVHGISPSCCQRANDFP
jgi:hypothetical protein